VGDGGTEIENITRFEELAINREEAPSAVGLLD
jgi:glyoxylate carboligase